MTDPAGPDAGGAPGDGGSDDGAGATEAVDREAGRVSDGQPSRDDERPSGDDEQSGGDDERPSGDDGQSDGDDEQPGDGEPVQPVELLVQLAEDGEIDPWDIDIVAVTDKFLARLDDADLRTSGRALFYASVLLRMKGDALLHEEPEEPAAEEEPWDAWGEEPATDYDPVTALEAEMDRRLDRKRVRGSPETLDELVHELRDAERRMWWKEAREYDTSASPHGFRRGTQTLDYRMDDAGRLGGEPTEADVTGSSHDEDIEAVIDAVHGALRDQYEQGREEVLFAEVAGTGGSRVLTYLALLFLANRDHVHLRQDELFGDLWIRDRDASGAEAEGDPAAVDEAPPG